MSILVQVTKEDRRVEVPVAVARDAYQLALAEGFEGTRAEWLASLAPDPDTVIVESPQDDDMIQRVGGSWVKRTLAQIKTALGLGGAAYLNVGSAAGTVCSGDDTRLSNSRTPNTHASSHSTAGDDPITPSSIGAAAANHNHNGVYDPAGTAAAAVSAHASATDPHGDRAYADAQIAAAVTGLLDFKSDTDCSTNPSYPAASKGDAYFVSVAGKIGGASGKSVEVGDLIVAKADNAGGIEAFVGASWFVLEHNLVGALVASNNLSDLADPSTARTNLGLGTAATVNTSSLATLSGTNTFSGNIIFQRSLTTFGQGGVYDGTLRLHTSSGANTYTTIYPSSTSAINIYLPNATGTLALKGDAVDMAATMTAATSKTTPVDADQIPLIDSAASNVLKKLTWSNLKATLKTYLDTLYVALTGNQIIAGNKTFSGNIDYTSPTRPTCAATGTPAATDLITLNDAREQLLRSTSTLWMREDFLQRGSSIIGDLGWFNENEGAGATFDNPTGAFPNIGITRIKSGTDNLKGSCLYRGYVGTLLTNPLWEATFIAKLEQTTDCDMILGFSSNGGTAGLYGSYGGPSFGVRYSSAKDTNFMFYSKNSNSDFAANDSNNYELSTGITADTNFHNIGIRSLTAGVMQMRIDGGAWTTIAHVNNTGSTYLPLFLVLARTTSQKLLQCDYFSFLQTGLSR